MKNRTEIVEPTVEDPFAAAFAGEDVRGRSLWVDAWHRLLKNRAAVVSGIIMAVMLLLVVFGPMVLPWEADFTDWDNTASPPSLETSHWFGTDAVGRDILVRTLEGGRISLLVGFVATLVSLVIGVSYGAVAYIRHLNRLTGLNDCLILLGLRQYGVYLSYTLFHVEIDDEQERRSGLSKNVHLIYGIFHRRQRYNSGPDMFKHTAPESNSVRQDAS